MLVFDLTAAKLGATGRADGGAAGAPSHAASVTVATMQRAARFMAHLGETPKKRPAAWISHSAGPPPGHGCRAHDIAPRGSQRFSCAAICTPHAAPQVGSCRPCPL